MSNYLFKEHGVWQCRGFDFFDRHYNRAFRLKRHAEKFIRAMNNEKNCCIVDHY